MKIYRTQDGGESRNASQICTQAEIVYLVTDVTDKDAAFDLVFSEMPQQYKGLPFKEVRFDQFVGDKNAQFSVIYGKNSTSSNTDKEEGAVTANFDCSGGSVRVVHAISQRIAFGEISAGGAVGWNGKSGADSEIKGVDVPTANMRKTYRKLIRANRLTTAYEDKISSCVGKVNKSKFKGRDKGEVMFLGASYTAPENSSDKVWVSFNFAIRPNEDKIVVNGISCKGGKEGWEVISSIDKSVVDQNGIPGSEISAIHISQVAEYADFSVLGL